MRLTEPGLYASRDGRVAMDWNARGVLQFVVRNPNGWMQCHLLANDPDTEGEWQRIDLAAVTWPQLPPKPPQCYVTYSKSGPYWRQFQNGESVTNGISARDYLVVPHPDNDPEAVAMIEAAKVAGDV